MEPVLYTVSEAAELLKVNRNSIKEECYKGVKAWKFKNNKDRINEIFRREQWKRFIKFR